MLYERWRQPHARTAFCGFACRKPVWQNFPRRLAEEISGTGIKHFRLRPSFCGKIMTSLDTQKPQTYNFPMVSNKCQSQTNGRMLRRVCLLGFLLAFGLLGSGCVPVPVRVTLSPGVSGVVVDANTGAPVGGAKIGLYGTYLGDLLTTTEAEERFAHWGTFKITTDKNGRFSFPPERIWEDDFTYWSDPPSSPYRGALTIQRDGYHSALRNFSTKRSKLKLEEPIRLKPLEPATQNESWHRGSPPIPPPPSPIIPRD